MNKWMALLAGCIFIAAVSNTRATEVVSLDGVTLDSGALDNGCSTATLSADEVTDCRFRVCFSLLKSLWLLEEADRRDLDPDTESMERQQAQYEKSHTGEQLAFTVLPRVKFQRKAIELYRERLAEDPNYSPDDLWKDVATSATELEIPERALRALVVTYGTDQARFLEFQKMFPDDHESLLERSRNDWEREARRVALEKEICPDDSLTSKELTRAREVWQDQLETAPDATDAMLRQRKREFQVNLYLRNQISDKAKFDDKQFREGLIAWVDEKILGPDKQVFGSDE